MMDRSHTTFFAGVKPALREPVSLEVPVRLQGESAELSTFFEDTNTVLVFPEGAVLRVAGELQPGQSVLVTNRATRQQLAARVVYAKSHRGVKGYAEVEFAAPVPGFWEGTALSGGAYSPAPQTTAPPAPAPVSALPQMPGAIQPQLPLFAGSQAMAATTASLAGAASIAVPATAPPLRAATIPAVLPPQPPPVVDEIEQMLAAKRKESEAEAMAAARAASAFADNLLNPAEKICAEPAPKRRAGQNVRAVAAAVAVLTLVGGASFGAWTLRAEKAALVEPARPVAPAPPDWAVAGFLYQPEPLSSFPLRRVRTKELRPVMLPAHLRVSAELRRRIAEGKFGAPAIARRADISSAMNDAPAGEATAAPVAAASLSLIPVVGTNAPAPPVVAESKLTPVRLVFSRPPIYPPMARRARTQGEVVIHARVDETGKVTQMRVISGPSVLRQAALDALSQWKYEPAMLNGRPVAVDTAVSIKFQL